ncbi:MAG: N-acetylmuramic acid 6-phosphate etherase [Clostridia bacterium]|nr:N-acetylmuramic acid 6-phosphate etherase [Clostridia bacterium]
MTDYGRFSTEKVLEASKNIDKMSALEIAELINAQDKTVAYAVEKALPETARGIDALAGVLKGGGRIFYCGAGTSGRLGVLDASECPPTYGVSPETVQGVLAGGKEAAFASIEDAEDDEFSIVRQLQAAGFCAKDACVGISASGSAKCVQGALKYARGLGAATVAVSNNADSPLIELADISIIAVVGPEVISGSTRMKAGTSQKMILNMLSTGAMVKYGRTLGNLMAYMVPSNAKLAERALRMICAETGADRETAYAALKKNGDVIADAIRELKSRNT